MIYQRVIRMSAVLVCAAGLWGIGRAPRDRSIVEYPPEEQSQRFATPRVNRDLDSLGRVIVSGNVFRVDRSAAAVRYGSRPPSADESAHDRPQPALELTGIVWAAVPAAVLEGLPGLAGARVVQAGEQYGDLVVRNIARDTVWIAGADTTWTLTLQRPR